MPYQPRPAFHVARRSVLPHSAHHCALSGAFRPELPPIQFVDEKREQPRFEVCLTARWCGSTAHQPVRISDLSEGGCYIDTIVEVTVNEIIKIEVALSDGSWLQLKGVVAHHFPRLGFGVRFLDLDDEQLKSLRSLLPGHEVSDRAKATPDLENSETQRNGDVAPIDDAQLASGSLM